MKTVVTIMGPFTQGKYDRLKETYDRAVKNEQAEFEFDNHTYLTSFAKYMLEYLAETFEHGITTRTTISGD